MAPNQFTGTHTILHCRELVFPSVMTSAETYICVNFLTSVQLLKCLSVRPSVRPSVRLSVCLSVCLSSIGDQTAGPLMTKFGVHLWVYLGMVPTLKKSSSTTTQGHWGGGLGCKQFTNLGKLPNYWTDPDQMCHTCAD